MGYVMETGSCFSYGASYPLGDMGSNTGWTGDSNIFDHNPATTATYILGSTAMTSVQPGYGRPGAGMGFTPRQIKMIVVYNGPDPNSNVSSLIVMVKNYLGDLYFVATTQVFSGLSTAANAVNVLDLTAFSANYGQWAVFPNANTALNGSIYYPWKINGIEWYSYSGGGFSYIMSDKE